MSNETPRKLWKVSNYRPYAIIERDPAESTFKRGDDTFVPVVPSDMMLLATWLIKEHNSAVELELGLAQATDDLDTARACLREIKRLAFKSPINAQQSCALVSVPMSLFASIDFALGEIGMKASGIDDKAAGMEEA